MNNATRSGIGVSAETLGRTICTRKASSARCTRKRWKEGVKERRGRQRGRGKGRSERGSARYQVPVPSRHHGGITVSGCPIGFNRKRLSRAAEFCRETTASPSSRPSIYGYYPFALEHQSAQTMWFLSFCPP